MTGDATVLVPQQSLPVFLRYAYSNPTVYVDPDGHQSKVYSWTDENGRKHFGDQPPAAPESVQRYHAEGVALTERNAAARAQEARSGEYCRSSRDACKPASELIDPERAAAISQAVAQTWTQNTSLVSESPTGAAVYLDEEQEYLEHRARVVVIAAWTGVALQAASFLSGSRSGPVKSSRQGAEAVADVASGTAAHATSRASGGKGGSAVDLFADSRGKDLAKLSNKEVGDLGEGVARKFLQDNKHTNILSLQNKSGNGIDFISRTSDGRLAFTEVKASRTGAVADLSARQQKMDKFVEDVLTQAADGRGRYRNISLAEQDLASDMLREFRRNPDNISGNVIGVDLKNEILRVSPWARK